MSCNELSYLKLIEEVKKYPCLYDTALKPSQEERSKAFEEVAKVMHMTASACREKMKRMRSGFIRHLKKGNEYGRNRPYFLADHLDFLEPHLTKFVERPKKRRLLRKQPGQEENLMNLPNDVPEEESQRDPLEIRPEFKVEIASDIGPQYWIGSVTHKPKMRKLDPQNTETKCKELAVQSLLDDLARVLKLMDFKQFKTFKRRVLTVIDNIMTE